MSRLALLRHPPLKPLALHFGMAVLNKQQAPLPGPKRAQSWAHVQYIPVAGVFEFSTEKCSSASF